MLFSVLDQKPGGSFSLLGSSLRSCVYCKYLCISVTLAGAKAPSLFLKKVLKKKERKAGAPAKRTVNDRSLRRRGDIVNLISVLSLLVQLNILIWASTCNFLLVEETIRP